MDRTEENNEPVSLPDQMTADFNGVLYFSYQNCGVCKVLRPKVEQMLEKNFPKLTFSYVDIEKSPVIAAGHSVFTVPVILVFFEGQEFYRFARGIGVGELQRSIERPYNLKFG
jgi:thioredoxin-like negative regulator of GroEL